MKLSSGKIFRSIGNFRGFLYRRLVLQSQMLLAVAHDGTTGDDANESVFIIDYWYKILLAGSCDEILHGGGDADRHVIPAAVDFHNMMIFCLSQIHAA